MQESVQAISLYYVNIQVSEIILAGSSEQMVDVQESLQTLVKELPPGRLKYMQNTVHKLHHTHPDVVMEAIYQVTQDSC